MKFQLGYLTVRLFQLTKFAGNQLRKCLGGDVRPAFKEKDVIFSTLFKT